MRWCGHPPVPSDHLHAGAGVEPVVSDDVSVPDGLHVGHESNPRLYGFTAAAHRANHRAAFPDMQAAARQKRRCAREDEQNRSQTGAPGASAADNGQTAADGGRLYRSCDACAAAHPDVLLHAFKQLLSQEFAENRRPGPNRPPPSVFVGGYDDDKRHDAARLPLMARRCGRLGVEHPQCLSEMRYHEGRLWQEDPSSRDKKTEPDSNLRSIRFWMLHNTGCA